MTPAQIITLGKQVANINLAPVKGVIDSRGANLQDDAAVAEDILAAIAVFWPPAAAIAALIALDAELAPFVNVQIQPDPNPMDDAQLKMGR